MNAVKKVWVVIFGLFVAMFSGMASAAGNYDSIVSAITAEQAPLVAAIFGIAGVLALVYAAKRGAGIGLSALKGR